MGTSYRLILQSGTGSGTEYPLEKTDLFLGRDMSNDIVVNDSEVSRRHAHLVMEGTTYRIEDLGSTNGTFIRGQRLAAPVLLRPGEIITIGEKVVLRFEALVTDVNSTIAVQRGAPQAVQQPVAPVAAPVPMPSPVAPPQAQPYAPPVQAAPVYPPQAQAYTPIPVTPAYPVAGMNPPYQPPAKKKSKGLIILLILIGIVVLFCVIPAIIIEVTDSYCALFPGIFNMLVTGACP
jgi:hypothetical protein